MLVGFGSLKAQNGLSFYHLGKSTPQGNHMNPSFFPDAKFYVSLPALSGIQVSLNNGFGYEDVFTEIPNTDSVLLDVDNLLAKLDNGDFLEFNSNISLFQFGMRLGQSSFFTIFANERVSAGIVYPLELLKYAWRGNQEFLGQTFTESDLRVSVNYFREYGIGYSQEIDVLGGRKLRVGARVKMLQGIVNANTSDNLSIDVRTDADRFNLNIAVNDPVFRTAGIESIDGNDAGSYITSNANKGVGFDFGAELELNEKINLALAVNDLGGISWTEGIKNYTVNNTEIDYEGLDLKNTDDLSQALKDTLSAKFDDDTNTESFKTNLDTRTFIGGTYQILPKGRISASISNKFILGKTNTTIGVGYTHRFGKAFTASTTIVKKPNQKPSIGGGFALRLGFFQLYSTIDNAFVFNDVTKVNKIDLRFGINFLFGRNKAKTKRKSGKFAIPEEYLDTDEIEPSEG